MNKILWLRISYWLGAIADGLSVIPMMFPYIIGLAYGIPNFNPGDDYNYAMWIGIPLMLGWTSLLIWADQEPVERKGVLLLTVFPVLIGLVIGQALAVVSGFIIMERMIPLWIFQIIATALFIFSYINARDLVV